MLKFIGVVVVVHVWLLSQQKIIIISSHHGDLAGVISKWLRSCNDCMLIGKAKLSISMTLGLVS